MSNPYYGGGDDSIDEAFRQKKHQHYVPPRVVKVWDPDDAEEPEAPNVARYYDHEPFDPVCVAESFAERRAPSDDYPSERTVSLRMSDGGLVKVSVTNCTGSSLTYRGELQP